LPIYTDICKLISQVVLPVPLAVSLTSKLMLF